MISIGIKRNEIKKKDIDRILSRISFKRKEDCWDCSYTKRCGYPLVTLNGKSRQVSNVIYCIYKGEIPSGKILLHSCDNPNCVNPNHLSIGTDKENTRDMINKKRHGKRRPLVVHRLYYTMFKKDPGFMLIDHMCRNTKCFNPEHLREVTISQNNLENSRSICAKKNLVTKCPKGHFYDKENTQIINGRHRRCKSCEKDAREFKNRNYIKMFKYYCRNGHKRTNENTFYERNGDKRCLICKNITQNKLRLRRKIHNSSIN